MDLSLVYFPSAVLLGALHALEPGHAKTLTAAYLIGTKGTKRDATILGLSVATTHSAVVVVLCVIAVFLGRETFTGEASHYLAIGSSVLVIALGAWLLRRRLKALGRAKAAMHGPHDHSHAPDPVDVKGSFFAGSILIVDTPAGERFKLISKSSGAVSPSVSIERSEGNTEVHEFVHSAIAGEYLSLKAPDEPHEFRAVLSICAADKHESFPFEMHEPEHHHHHGEVHDHALLSDEEHAKAHASDLPEYVTRGERPTFWQIVTFGAAGGLVPCPAAISVMLLSLSLNETGKGLLLVVGFGIGLAVTLVGVGLLVVMGISKIAAGGRFSGFTAYAPTIAAGMVMLSGTFGLIFAFFHST